MSSRKKKSATPDRFFGRLAEGLAEGSGMKKRTAEVFHPVSNFNERPKETKKKQSITTTFQAIDTVQSPPMLSKTIIQI